MPEERNCRTISKPCSGPSPCACRIQPTSPKSRYSEKNSAILKGCCCYCCCCCHFYYHNFSCDSDWRGWMTVKLHVLDLPYISTKNIYKMISTKPVKSAKKKPKWFNDVMKNHQITKWLNHYSGMYISESTVSSPPPTRPNLWFFPALCSDMLNNLIFFGCTIKKYILDWILLKFFSSVKSKESTSIFYFIFFSLLPFLNSWNPLLYTEGKQLCIPVPAYTTYFLLSIISGINNPKVRNKTNCRTLSQDVTALTLMNNRTR